MKKLDPNWQSLGSIVAQIGERMERERAEREKQSATLVPGAAGEAREEPITEDDLQAAMPA